MVTSEKWSPSKGFHVEWAQNFGRRQALHNSRLSVDVQHWLKLDCNLKADFDFYIHIQLNKINIFSRVDVVPLAGGGFYVMSAHQTSARNTLQQPGTVSYFTLVRHVSEGTFHGFSQVPNVDFSNDLWQSQTNMQTEEGAKLNSLTDVQMKLWA